ncbi:MAG: methyltransferase domain-containing protein [Candidatus Thorarchaeota archaeon]|nr:methyltransferase domain-containing protein [Candidatus Thorarchaeota archaeon]
MAKLMKDRQYATPFTVLHAASLLGQRSRLVKFRNAIQKVVKDGDYVVDLGTGSGVLAIMAAKAKAGKVSAIEINPESIEYARRAARLNGVEDLIEFVQCNFSDFVPDTRADIVICEMLSSMMLIEQQIPASVYAIERILKPSGVLIPQEVDIFLAPVESPEIWGRFRFQEIQFPRVVQSAIHETTRDLADMSILESLKLMSLKQDTTIDETLQFTIVDKGTVHGLVGVFEARLCGDIVLKMEDGWKQLFIPLEQPIEVSSGDIFTVRVAYRPGKYDSLSIEIL